MRRRAGLDENEYADHGVGNPLHWDGCRIRMRVLSSEGALRFTPAGVDRLCCRRDGCRLDLEPDRPGNRAVTGAGALGFPASFFWLLAWHSVPSSARPYNPAPASQHWPDRRAEKPSYTDSDAGSCRDAAQYP